MEKNRRRKILGVESSYKVLVVSLLLYFIGSQLYTFFPVSPNVIIGILVVFSILLVFAFEGDYYRILMVCACALMILLSIVRSDNLGGNLSEGIRVISLIFMFVLITKKYACLEMLKAFDSLSRIIKLLVFLFTVLTYVELILPSCYTIGNVKGGWGDNAYFVGFTTSQHMAASNALLLLALVFVYFHKKNFSYLDFAFLMAPALAVLQSGARVYLIPLAAGFVLYYFFRLKGQRLSILIVPILLVGLVYLFLHTGMFAKFVAVSTGVNLENQGLAYSLTNSRTWMWENLISSFGEATLFDQVFGQGFNLSEDSIGKTAHNDLLFMLVSSGVLGLLVYCIAVLRALCSLWKHHLKDSQYGKIVWVSLALYVAAPILLNGLYNNPHLVFAVVVMFSVSAGLARECRITSIENDIGTFATTSKQHRYLKGGGKAFR